MIKGSSLPLAFESEEVDHQHHLPYKSSNRSISSSLNKSPLWTSIISKVRGTGTCGASPLCSLLH